MNSDKLTAPSRPLVQWMWIATSGFLLLALSLWATAWYQGKIKSYVLQTWAAPTPVTPHLDIRRVATDPVTEKRALEIAAALDAKWGNLLLAIEKAANKQVTMLQLRPDFSKGTFDLVGEARTFSDITAYMDSLEQTGLVNHIELVHEQGVSHENVETIEFSLRGAMASE